VTRPPSSRPQPATAPACLPATGRPARHENGLPTTRTLARGGKPADHGQVTAFIGAPPRIPWYLRLGLSVARRRSGRDLLPAQLLAWYPRAAIGSAVLEALVADHDRHLDERMLKLVRVAVAFTVECPFCIGLNSQGWETVMSADELAAVQDVSPPDLFPRSRDLSPQRDLFSPRERIAIEYARLASATPLAIPPAMGETLRSAFTEREIVVLATTIAQVNYWARLVSALGCPAEG